MVRRTVKQLGQAGDEQAVHEDRKADHDVQRQPTRLAHGLTPPGPGSVSMVS